MMGLSLQTDIVGQEHAPEPEVQDGQEVHDAPGQEREDQGLETGHALSVRETTGHQAEGDHHLQPHDHQHPQGNQNHCLEVWNESLLI